MIQAPSSTDFPSTSVKKRQCTLLEALSGEKRPRTTETTETLQESSHKKLRSKLSGQGLVAFEEELKNFWTRHDEVGQKKIKLGWSCGVWACRLVERQMRDNRSEARLPPPSPVEIRNRANEFICKIKHGEKKPVEKKKPEDESKHYETHELAHASFEEAQHAALVCPKCLPTKAGTKGCRACMGDHFEVIRQRKSKGK